jgi:predicted Zn-dependent protease
LIKRLVTAVFILLIAAACATTKLPPVGEMQSLQLQTDERRVWNRSEEEQRRLDNSNYIYADPVLTGYVNEVAQHLIPDDIKGKGLTFQVKIIKNPLLNAFAYPNGVIYVHTGLLSKMENEAQLATVLGHEMTHVTHRHTIENFRSVKNTTAVLATLQMAAVPFGAYGGLANVLGTVGAMAAVTGYSRELETEADQGGLELLVRAGYDPQEAPRLFIYLQKDVEEQKIKEPFFFGTHPRLQERIDNYSRYLKANYAGIQGIKNSERFMEVISPLLLDNAALDLSLGRFTSAQNGIERYLQKEPQSARAHYYLGELYRQRNQAADGAKAVEEYNLSVALDPSYPEPYRGTGLIYYKQGLKQAARAKFEKYLTLSPNAEDAAYIEQYIHEIKEQ